MKQASGFTLLEMTIAVAILSVVSLLSFLAIRSGAETSIISAAKEEVSSGLRDTMMEVSKEVRQAYTARTVESAPKHAPDNAQSVKTINSGKGLTFYIPTKGATAKPDAAGPITIELQNEDTNGNSKLDAGEDANGDGVLTRRLVRKFNGATTPLGAANTISAATFTLADNQAANSNIMNTLTLRLQGDRLIERGGEEFKVKSSVEMQISLEN